MTNAMSRTIANPQTEMHQVPVTLPLAEMVARLNDYQPHGLGGYPSMLARLAAEARAGRLTISPLRVTSTSEPLSPDVRIALNEAWDAPLGNVYGLTEAGCLGMPCWQSPGMHLAEDLVIVEPVDQAGNRVGAGETAAKFHLTNLFNTTMPLIRYEITDQIRLLDEPCPCGSTLRRVADIQGRLDDTFTYRGGISIHPHVFRSILSQAAGVREYQVRQTPGGAAIVVVTEGIVDEGGLAARLEDALGAAGLSGTRVTVRSATAIERQESGKLRLFVPLSTKEVQR